MGCALFQYQSYVSEPKSSGECFLSFFVAFWAFLWGGGGLFGTHQGGRPPSPSPTVLMYDTSMLNFAFFQCLKIVLCLISTPSHWMVPNSSAIKFNCVIFHCQKQKCALFQGHQIELCLIPITQWENMFFLFQRMEFVLQAYSMDGVVVCSTKHQTFLHVDSLKMDTQVWSSMKTAK